jgi:hypothetical protein
MPGISLHRPIEQRSNHTGRDVHWVPPLGGLLALPASQIMSTMTPTEIARELELLRPFLKEIMIRDYGYDRVRLGPAFKEPEPPDVTIDKVINTVLEGTRPDGLPC